MESGYDLSDPKHPTYYDRMSDTWDNRDKMKNLHRGYRWVGWFGGMEDCEPPEPDKYWLEIQDDEFNEVCVVVYRTPEFIETDDAVIEREQRAQMIVEALNLYEATKEAENG